jgi:hypothetical protein
MVRHNISADDLRADLEETKPFQVTTFAALHGDKACDMADEIQAQAGKLYLYQPNGEDLYRLLEHFIERHLSSLLDVIRSVANEP